MNNTQPPSKIQEMPPLMSPQIVRRLTWVIIVVFALIIVGFTITRALASSLEPHTSAGISTSASFALPTSRNAVEAEEISTSAEDSTSWTLDRLNLSVSNQAEIDAAAQADRAELSNSSDATAASKNSRRSGRVGGASGTASGNRYVPGQCTWYAYNRRAALGKPIGSFWGNAGSWGGSASSAGFSVNHKPQVGDVMVMPGHVAVVEKVGENNTVYVSEMNWQWQPFRYNERWVSNASRYTFIH